MPRQIPTQLCVNPGKQLMNGMHGGGGGAGGPGGLPEIMIGSVNGAFGSKWKVWQTFMSQSGTAFIPEPGHHSWPQSPLALQAGRPSGGAHGGTFALDGEHWGAACAVPAASPTAAALRPPEMRAAVATAATKFDSWCLLSKDSTPVALLPTPCVGQAAAAYAAQRAPSAR